MFDKIKKFTEKIVGTTRISYEDDFDDNDYEEIVEVKPKMDTNKFKVLIKYMQIEDSEDIKKILNYIREGNYIVFANYKKMKEKDAVDLRRSIDKIKRTCEAVNSDIVGLEENFILIYPSFASIPKEDIK